MCLLSVANVWRDLWSRIQTYYRLVGLREHLEHVVSMFPSKLEFREIRITDGIICLFSGVSSCLVLISGC